MLIAVTTENNMVYQHFGHCENFTLYKVEGKEIKEKKNLSSGGNGHSALATLLGNYKVNTLICGGIGGGARVALGEQGIEVVPGASGDVDEVVKAYLDGVLEHDPDYVCHDHDHGEAHTCGEHGCSH